MCTELDAGTLVLHAQTAAGNKIDGTIATGDRGRRVNALSVTYEGVEDSLDYPIDVWSVRKDSLYFQFGPAEIKFSGRCTGGGKAQGAYEWYPEKGVWQLIANR